MTGPQVLQLILLTLAAIAGMATLFVPPPAAHKLIGVAVASVAFALSVPLWQVA